MITLCARGLRWVRWGEEGRGESVRPRGRGARAWGGRLGARWAVGLLLQRARPGFRHAIRERNRLAALALQRARRGHTDANEICPSGGEHKKQQTATRLGLWLEKALRKLQLPAERRAHVGCDWRVSTSYNAARVAVSEMKSDSGTARGLPARRAAVRAGTGSCYRRY